MAKGSQFEREFCKDLSLWWTHDKTDEMFWRSSNSGGRATVRAKAGKSTSGQHGDVAAIHPDGIALIDLITFELKRGYSKSTIHDVFDKSESAAQQTWEKWYEQASTSARLAGSLSWLIVHKRDRRDTMAYMPSTLFDILRAHGCFTFRDVHEDPYMQVVKFQTKIKCIWHSDATSMGDAIYPIVNIVMLRWSDFKRGVPVDVLRTLTKKHILGYPK